MKAIGWKHYVLWFLGSVAAAVALLFLCACLPQGPIDEHVRESALLLSGEGTYPKLFDGADSAQLDNYTDAIILDVSRGTRLAEPSSILTNPVHRAAEDPVEALSLYAGQEAGETPSFYYPRYWMGFRVPVRGALLLLNYAQIRRFVSLAFFCLAALALVSVAQNAGGRAALLFALSLILMRPQVICQSLQFSCCFLLALAAVPAIPWLRRHRRWEGLFFWELGILVMYFDFYTAPLLVFGLPIVYLCLLDLREGEKISLRRVLGSALLWLGGYALMWLMKLALTSLLTPENALETGLASFFSRVGVTKNPGQEALYHPLAAFRAVWRTLSVDKTGACFWALGLLGAAGALAVGLRRARGAGRALQKTAAFPLLGLLPLLWFALAAQPTAIHAWFQYRSAAVSFWALGAWLDGLFRLSEKGEKT